MDFDSTDKISVLLVDDRPEKLLALEAVLSDLPLDLVRATSGRDALRCLLSREFACILLDINMPGMDGFETASLIRQRKSSQSTPIIFVSAYQDDVFMSRGYSLGAVDYILQPVVPEILRSKVSVFVDLYRKSLQIARSARWQEQRAAQLQMLASAAVAINAAPSMARTLQVITDAARDVIGAHQAVTLFRTDADTLASFETARTSSAEAVPAGSARGFSSFSAKYADWRGRPLRLDGAATSAVALSRVPTRLTPAQVKAHSDYPLILRLEAAGDIPPVIGMLAAPLIGRDGRNMGVIYLSDNDDGDFTPDDEAILVQLSQMAAVAIENHLSAEARQANRAKDQFIAVLSHELRTPLTPVLATIASLQSDKRLPADVHEDLQVIRRNVELEARLIDDLLDLTRISKGKVALNMEVVDVNELLREAANICRADIAEKGIDLRLDFGARRRYAKADATRLEQVLWNLLKNAVKFTPNGGRITVESYNEDDASPHGALCIRVMDSGIGIEPDILPRIFNAFEQGRSAITRQFGGLGLGLAISKALVDQHGGTLAAASEGKGKGASFLLRLPATAEAPAAVYHTPRLVSEGPPRPVSVLLVEDHSDTARVMSKLLRSHGYDIQTAHSVTEAVRSLKAHRFDFLVSDIGLPDGTGLDLMRQAQTLQPLVGVALSGFGMEADIQRSKDAGFAEHLTKPLNFQLLIDTIDRLTSAVPPSAATHVAG